MPRTNRSADPLTQMSKYVSYLLRHDPRVGEVVDEGGWASLKQLNCVVRKDGKKLLTEEDLISVTENSHTKKRFEYEYRPLKSGNRQDSTESPDLLNPDTRIIFIRAMNGHSFPLKTIIFEPFTFAETEEVPKFLYHATNSSTVESILAEGLKPMGRQFVHMYEFPNLVKYDAKRNTLLAIGPITGTAREKLTLYRSKNGYIQCPHTIPPEFIQLASRKVSN